MIESDRDLRNPAGMLMLEKVAKAVFQAPGVAMVQSITRPLGSPLDNSSIPFQMSLQSTLQAETLPFQQARAHDLLTQVAEITNSIDLLKQQMALQQQLSDATLDQAEKFDETSATVKGLRDKVANVDDFLRPIRTTSTGNRTATTSRSATPSDRCSTLSTGRQTQRPVGRGHRRAGQDDRAAAADPRTHPAATGDPGTQ